jgi:hypothetical protein
VDRRRFSRYPCSGAAEIIQSGKRWGWGTLSDISRGGCYIETMHPLPTGTEAELRLTIAGVSLDISADVVSSDPMFGMGMEFVMVHAEQWNKLPQIIEKVTGVDLSTGAQQVEASDEDAQRLLHAALQHLEQAQKELQEALHGKGARRAPALQFTENAITEVKKVCKWGSATDKSDPASMGSGYGWCCEVH